MTHHNRLVALLDEMGFSFKRRCDQHQPHQYQRMYVHDDIAEDVPVRECLLLLGDEDNVGEFVEFRFDPNGKYVGHSIICE